MPELEWAFVLQVVIGTVILLLMLILLHKINRIKMQMDNIKREVQSYIDYVIQENEETKDIEEINGRKREVQKKSGKSITKKEKEEVQNHLIQSVLREYFP